VRPEACAACSGMGGAIDTGDSPSDIERSMALNVP
jgi:hypothetical protein